MLCTPYHYRDDRTTAGVKATHALVPARELYATNGLQHLPFNTLFQLADDRETGSLACADQMLLIPDLLAFWLTGVDRAEVTNASTTGLLNVHTRQWDDALIARLGLRRGLFAELVEPGKSIGPLLPAVGAEIGATGISVTAVGSHDTASAVVAVPASGTDFAYISSGTWSLVGVELDRPVVSEASRAANFTNEGGVDGRVRFLRNVSGLWLLSESVRMWEASGGTIDLPQLIEQAAVVSGAARVFDANDPRFLAPGDMPARIAQWFVEHDMSPPGTPAEFVRSIIESLADAYAAAIDAASMLSGTTVTTIHIVGGGSQNALLCQLTADRTGRHVLAGPVEATAIGNVLVQARALGFATGSLESLRSLVAAATSPTRYLPDSGTRR